MKRASIIIVSIAAVMIVIGGILSIVSLAQGAKYYGIFNIGWRELETKSYSDFDTINKINVDIDLASVKVKTGDDFKVVINSNTKQTFTVEESNGTLIIIEESKDKWNYWNIGIGNSKTTIDLYIPAEYQLEDVTIESDAASIDISQLLAKSVTLEVDAGKIDVSNINTEYLSVRVNAGKVDIEGKVDGDINIQCDVGAIVLLLEGDELDYQVNGSVDVGSFKFNNNSYGGVLNSDFNFGTGRNKIDVDCAAGSVKIKVN